MSNDIWDFMSKVRCCVRCHVRRCVHCHVCYRTKCHPQSILIQTLPAYRKRGLSFEYYTFVCHFWYHIWLYIIFCSHWWGSLPPGLRMRDPPLGPPLIPGAFLKTSSLWALGMTAFVWRIDWEWAPFWYHQCWELLVYEYFLNIFDTKKSYVKIYFVAPKKFKTGKKHTRKHTTS